MYDLMIVGGGPAGAAAGVYAARKQLKTAFITNEWGGQSVDSPDVQNWIGTPSISGPDLAKQLRTHVEAYAEPCIDIISPARAKKLSVTDEHVSVTTEDDTTYDARALLVATGAHRRKLTVPGAADYDQKGLTYCASCDGPLFTGMDVVVIGGGNAGFESAAQLLAYAKSVTLLNRSDMLKADGVTVQKVSEHENMTVITNAEPVEVYGEAMVTGVKWRDTKTGEEHDLPVKGVFVEIGLIPNTEWVRDALTCNEHMRVVVDPRTQRTSHARVWAAGDCTDGLYHQNNIAAGDAVKALEDIYTNLRAR